MPLVCDFFPACFPRALTHGTNVAPLGRRSSPKSPNRGSSTSRPGKDHTHTRADDEKRVFIGGLVKALSAEGLAGVVRARPPPESQGGRLSTLLPG